MNTYSHTWAGQQYVRRCVTSCRDLGLGSVHIQSYCCQSSPTIKRHSPLLFV